MDRSPLHLIIPNHSISLPMEVKVSILEMEANDKENIPPNKNIPDAQKIQCRIEKTHKCRSPLMDLTHFYLDSSPLPRDFRLQSSVLISGFLLSNRKKYFAAPDKVYESRSKILRSHFRQILLFLVFYFQFCIVWQFLLIIDWTSLGKF